MDFIVNLTTIYGQSGMAWLEGLPKLQAQLTKQWNLSKLVPCTDLSYNMVLAGWRNEEPIILKIGIDLLAIQREYTAIKAFYGHGLVELLDADLDKGALLITRAVPGMSLVSLFPDSDDRALSIACDLVKNLHKAPIPAANSFPNLTEWLSIIDKDWDMPIDHLQQARVFKNDLLRNSSTQVLLHGDVHYANILSDNDRWVVIDPKGVLGDPLYDSTGALLREPFEPMMALPDIVGMLRRRIAFVAQYFNVKQQQIWKWTYVQNVMSICWSLEDGQDVTAKLNFLEILYQCR